MLVAVDEYSRFPFAFPCKNMNSQTVINCLNQLFCLFGLPGFIHSDRQASFMSKELKNYLHSRGVANSRTTPYHPTENSQRERIKQTVWRTVKLMLRNRKLSEESWEEVLPDALHSVRSLLCTSTNETPHERFLTFSRKSMVGKSMPNWLLNPGTVLLRRFVINKGDPLCDEVDLIEANPSFARIRLSNGLESTVSTKDLAPFLVILHKRSLILLNPQLSTLKTSNYRFQTLLLNP